METILFINERGDHLKIKKEYKLPLRANFFSMYDNECRRIYKELTNDNTTNYKGLKETNNDNFIAPTRLYNEPPDENIKFEPIKKEIIKKNFIENIRSFIRKNKINFYVFYFMLFMFVLYILLVLFALNTYY